MNHGYFAKNIKLSVTNKIYHGSLVNWENSICYLNKILFPHDATINIQRFLSN